MSAYTQREIPLIDIPRGGSLPVAMCYPNVYPIAMTSLGFQQVLRLFVEAGAHVERVCAPGEEGGEARSLESGRPLSSFALLAFSLTYELDVFSLVRMLAGAGIAPLAKDRREGDPIVLVGGVASSAHIPLVEDIADVIALGEAEPVIASMVDRLAGSADGRVAMLETLQEQPHIYVPALGTASGLGDITSAVLKDFQSHPCHSIILSPDDQFGGAFLVEVSRGCSHRCKFCVITYYVGGWRFRKAADLEASIDEYRGQIRKVGLLGAAVADHPELDRLAAFLVERGLHFSTSSLRADRLSDTFLELLRRAGNNTITLAPEAGNEERRFDIGKRMENAVILDVAERAGRMRFPKIKLYWMIGSPGRDLWDEVTDVIEMSKVIDKTFVEAGGGRITCSVSPFVPKAHTPYADAPQVLPKEMRKALRRIRRELAFKGRIKVPPHSVWEAHIEAALSVLPKEILTPRILRVGVEGEDPRSVFLEDDVSQPLAGVRGAACG